MKKGNEEKGKKEKDGSAEKRMMCYFCRAHTSDLPFYR